MNQCKTLTIDEYQTLCKENNVTLIDIRTDEEYAKENIPEAIHCPVSKLASMQLGPNDILVFHCLSDGRCHHAAAVFNLLPVKAVYILEGGITAWKEHKLPTRAGVGTDS